jgi:hypothetical protein
MGNLMESRIATTPPSLSGLYGLMDINGDLSDDDFQNTSISGGRGKERQFEN